MSELKKEERDIEKIYSVKQFVDKLRRLADCLEEGKKFQIQVANEKIVVPLDAEISVEHEREDGCEELEFQLKWEYEEEEEDDEDNKEEKDENDDKKEEKEEDDDKEDDDKEDDDKKEEDDDDKKEEKKED